MLDESSIPDSPVRVAVVGGGVSGLAAFWLLNEHSDHDVHLYEKRDYIGGDAHSIRFKGEGEECQIETAFFNSIGWPNFYRFLKYAGIPLEKGDGSLSYTIRSETGSWSWASHGFWHFFGASLLNLFSPQRWRLLFDFIRFEYDALDILRTAPQSDMSVGQVLTKGGYSRIFKEHYLFPLMGATLSVPFEAVSSALPIARLARGMHSMCMLQPWGRPLWETIMGGSIKYVNRIISRAPPRTVHINTEIIGMTRSDHGRWVIRTTNGDKEEYDRVILTGPAQSIHSILYSSNLGSPLVDEVLKPKQLQDMEIWVHTDETFLPENDSMHAAWNVLLDPSSPDPPSKDLKGGVAPVVPIEITYDVNRLQNLPRWKYGPILGTQAPLRPIHPSKVYARLHYTLDMDRYRSIENLPALRHELGGKGISIAGAWMSGGIHESGWFAGLQAAIGLGGVMPYPLASPDRPVPLPKWRDTLAWCALKVAGILVA